jgi:hypothetical protein
MNANINGSKNKNKIRRKVNATKELQTSKGNFIIKRPFRCALYSNQEYLREKI